MSKFGVYNFWFEVLICGWCVFAGRGRNSKATTSFGASVARLSKAERLKIFLTAYKNTPAADFQTKNLNFDI